MVGRRQVVFLDVVADAGLADPALQIDAEPVHDVARPAAALALHLQRLLGSKHIAVLQAFGMQQEVALFAEQPEAVADLPGYLHRGNIRRDLHRRRRELGCIRRGLHGRGRGLHRCRRGLRRIRFDLRRRRGGLVGRRLRRRHPRRQGRQRANQQCACDDRAEANSGHDAFDVMDGAEIRGMARIRRRPTVRKRSSPATAGASSVAPAGPRAVAARPRPRRFRSNRSTCGVSARAPRR